MTYILEARLFHALSVQSRLQFHNYMYIWKGETITQNTFCYEWCLLSPQKINLP